MEGPKKDDLFSILSSNQNLAKKKMAKSSLGGIFDEVFTDKKTSPKKGEEDNAMTKILSNEQLFSPRSKYDASGKMEEETDSAIVPSGEEDEYDEFETDEDEEGEYEEEETDREIEFEKNHYIQLDGFYYDVIDLAKPPKEDKMEGTDVLDTSRYQEDNQSDAFEDLKSVEEMIDSEIAKQLTTRKIPVLKRRAENVEVGQVQSKGFFLPEGLQLEKLSDYSKDLFERAKKGEVSLEQLLEDKTLHEELSQKLSQLETKGEGEEEEGSKDKLEGIREKFMLENEAEFVTRVGNKVIVRRPMAMKKYEDLNPSDFTPSEEEGIYGLGLSEGVPSSEREEESEREEGSERDIAPKLTETQKAKIFDRDFHGDSAYREDFFKEASFYEKPYELREKEIEKEAARLLPIRQQQHVDLHRASLVSPSSVLEVLDRFTGENYQPNKFESLSEIKKSQSGREEPFKVSVEKQSHFDFFLESLFLDFVPKASHLQLSLLQKFLSRSPTQEERRKTEERVLKIASHPVQDLPTVIEATTDLDSVKRQYIHAFKRAMEKAGEYNPTMGEEEEEVVEVVEMGKEEEAAFVAPFEAEAVVGESIERVEGREFEKQWETVLALRRGEEPFYLNKPDLTLYELRFRKLYPPKARKWVEYAKTQRGYFGRDGEWHVMTAKDYQTRIPFYKPVPTTGIEHLESFRPEIDEDLKGHFRFGFRPSEVNMFESLAPKLKEILSFHYASIGEAKKFRIGKEVELWRRHILDTGSPEIQIAVLTVKLREMEKHIKNNKKDKKTKIAYNRLTNRRKALMTFLRKKNVRKYFEVLYHLRIEDTAKWHWMTRWPN